MQQETKRRLGYFITYFLAAIVLFFMYATAQTSVGLMGGILCAGLGVKNLLEFLHLRKRGQENQDDQ